MSEMVERVARAICARRQMAARRCARHKGECIAHVLVLRDAGHEDQARAAIEAMREPTEAMVVSGAKQLGEAVQWDRLGDLPRPSYRTDARAVYDATIDEALK